MPDQVEVTRADQEARRAWVRDWYSCEGAFLALDEAFARHRQAAVQKARADALGKVVRLVAEYGEKKGNEGLALLNAGHSATAQAARAGAATYLLDAIRSLTKQEVSRTSSLSLLDR
jgi:hypothetical protein